MRLEGKVALITGGARGIGAAVARLFAREGASVAITDVREDEGSRLADHIASSGGDALFIKLDVTREDDWKSAIGAVLRRFGKLEILINNAGIHVKGTVEHTAIEDWQRCIDVNAKGVLLGTKAVIPIMRQAGGGSVVNISSMTGIAAFPESAVYGASKSAVRLLTKSTAGDCAKAGIRANSVLPGPIDTEMFRPLVSSEGGGEISKAIPIGRIGKPEDVAYGVLYLASDESSYVTGSELIIDGGITAIR